MLPPGSGEPPRIEKSSPFPAPGRGRAALTLYVNSLQKRISNLRSYRPGVARPPKGRGDPIDRFYMIITFQR